MGLLLLILLVIILLGAVPTWPHSRNWGYYPSGAVSLLLVVVILMVIFGMIDLNFNAAPPA